MYAGSLLEESTISELEDTLVSVHILFAVGRGSSLLLDICLARFTIQPLVYEASAIVTIVNALLSTIEPTNGTAASAFSQRILYLSTV